MFVHFCGVDFATDLAILPISPGVLHSKLVTKFRRGGLEQPSRATVLYDLACVRREDSEKVRGLL